MTEKRRIRTFLNQSVVTVADAHEVSDGTK